MVVKFQRISVKVIMHTWFKAIINLFICICKITCKPIGDLPKKKMNSDKRVHPPPPRISAAMGGHGSLVLPG